ncbi:addiction module protein [Cyanobium sp. ATX 6F1]|uniref:addiction module protein n=1 Tax=unclassified Cyanobium TaxID=2627006 RepID=UPI0020CE86FD|nr:addiction module protein [Cyanobium sp. ATX 6F1]MCP9916319.1 addiction module protein [Cyanobium sp. ATX 6F1]
MATTQGERMSIDLSGDVLDALTVQEKVRLLEQVWQSLCSHPADVSSPEWHAEVLRERSERLTDGRATRIPWAEAKAQLQQLGG